MGTKLNITCPVCSKSAVLSCYRDPDVGIDFDYDLLEGSECDCDLDVEENYQAIGKVAEDAYWDSLEPNFI
jgi:hypothetical protein